jgi:serine/threonine protein kinase
MNPQTVADRYRLDQFLAHINHSDFHDGYDTKDRAPVIVRLIRLDEPGLEWKLKGFMNNEMRVVKKLDHPSILRILDYGVQGTLYYLIHEHVAFETLHQHIRDHGKLALPMTLRYGLELADVLSRLHHIGIVHCDVKPENVLVVGTSVKLIEFSISNHVLEGPLVTGTPPYMSPEAAMGDAPAVSRDIWALGVLLFELLTGTLPFSPAGEQPEQMPELLRKIVKEPVPDITQRAPDLPPRLMALVNWMLEKAPAKRISSMRQVAAELEATLTGLQQGNRMLAVGDTVGERYRLQTAIGEGAFGQIFRAADLKNGQTVAVKKLRPDLANNPQHLARFKREADVLHQLNHPGIANVLDSIEDGQNHYIVVEYIAGGDLRSRLKSKQLSVREAVAISLDLAEALSHAHDLNIIHRDIKPENVLLAGDGSPRLTDFGIAHVDSTTRLTETGFILGTLNYIAPEILNGAVASKQSDIWSLGVMLFEILTGEVPFKQEAISQLLEGILHGPIPRLSATGVEFPEPLAALVDGLLQRDPDKRVGTMREVASRLQQIQASL